jgi:hypothetical protein
MRVSAVDSTNRLFLVEDIIPQELVSQLTQVDWLSVEWKRPMAQENWLRRELATIFETEIINNYILQLIPEIGKLCGVEFASASTTWWLDEPGFKVGIHTDGHLPSAMQLFWSADSVDYGTTFFNSKQLDNIRYQFQFIPNSGYLMLNGLDKDGSQPLQWHGMLKRTTTVRLTSYTTFGNYLVK